MTYEELIERLDPTVYKSLRRAVELGKWPDGRLISKEQRSICMEAVIYYETNHGIPEHERVGFIDRERKKSQSDDDVAPIRILN
ncbi:YeaC family protein [Marinobacter sp. 1Y8]